MRTCIVVLMTIHAGWSAACTVGFGDVSEHGADATHIFAGTIIEIRIPDETRSFALATVVVHEVWHGDLPDTVVVVSDRSSCGAPFREDMEFVFLPAPVVVDSFSDFQGNKYDHADWWRGPPLRVWCGTCERYERAGDAMYLVFGQPHTVANGQSPRRVTFDDQISILESGADEPRAEAAALTLTYSTGRLGELAQSARIEERMLFDRVLTVLAESAVRANGQSDRVSALALSAISGLGVDASPAIPVLLAHVEEDDAENGDFQLWQTLQSIDGNDPRVAEQLMSQTDDTRPGRLRAYAYSRFWYGSVAAPDGLPEPSGFIYDKAPEVRGIAMRILARRTSDPDTLETLARLALADSMVSVPRTAYAEIISSLKGEAAVRWSIAGMSHPDRAVRWAAFGARPLRFRDVPTRCAILRAALDSSHEDVRDRAAQDWRHLGNDCN